VNSGRDIKGKYLSLISSIFSAFSAAVIIVVFSDGKAGGPLVSEAVLGAVTGVVSIGREQKGLKWVILTQDKD
jgi:prepilin signal peptidase PulO-like enzyme (type II secretory pathway)